MSLCKRVCTTSRDVGVAGIGCVFAIVDFSAHINVRDPRSRWSIYRADLRARGGASGCQDEEKRSRRRSPLFTLPCPRGHWQNSEIFHPARPSPSPSFSFGVSGRRPWHGEGARCGSGREWEALSTRDRAGQEKGTRWLREIEIVFEVANGGVHEKSKLLRKKLMKNFILDND